PKNGGGRYTIKVAPSPLTPQPTEGEYALALSGNEHDWSDDAQSFARPSGSDFAAAVASLFSATASSSTTGPMLSPNVNTNTSVSPVERNGTPSPVANRDELFATSNVRVALFEPSEDAGEFETDWLLRNGILSRRRSRSETRPAVHR